MANAPVQPYYLKQLGATLPTTITPAQVDPWLQKPVYSRSAMQSLIGPLVSPADRQVIKQIQNTNWKLDYQLDVKTTLLVEPKTGAITDLAKIDQTLYATPDLANIRTLLAIFTKPAYASNQIVTATGQVMKNVLADPPRLRILNVTYSQTPESVAEITAYAKHKADSIDLVKHTVPLVLLILGLVVTAVGLVLLFVAGRRRSDPTGTAELDGPLFSPEAVTVPGPAPALRRASHRKPARHARGPSSWERAELLGSPLAARAAPEHAREYPDRIRSSLSEITAPKRSGTAPLS